MQNRITPKKSLSQNFLNDVHVAKKIVDSLQFTNNATVVEIGPGTGALTKHLLAYDIDVVALELDSRAVESLQSSYPSSNFPRLTVIEGDALKFNIEQQYNKTQQKLFVIGNIPYAITADLLFNLYANAKWLSECIVMVQKEVAKRIVAKPRTKEYGILTIATELVGAAKILFDVQPGSFYPIPKVTSSVFRVVFKNSLTSKEESKEIMQLVKAGFNQRRKKLSNALQSHVSKQYNIDIRTLTHPLLSVRAEELTTNDFIILKDFITAAKKDELGE